MIDVERECSACVGMIKRECSVCVGMTKRFGNVAWDNLYVYFILTATVWHSVYVITLLSHIQE